VVVVGVGLGVGVDGADVLGGVVDDTGGVEEGTDVCAAGLAALPHAARRTMAAATAGASRIFDFVIMPGLLTRARFGSQVYTTGQ